MNNIQLAQEFDQMDLLLAYSVIWLTNNDFKGYDIFTLLGNSDVYLSRRQEIELNSFLELWEASK